ncbi:MAG: ABC transporter substrate-binding protein [Desulfobacterales bacterium]|jgi:NitT/TauT family transport system substrate-binding protein|nr:ABC transporter substrate-binding protein [Deltaproteobacteria bacterium]
MQQQRFHQISLPAIGIILILLLGGCTSEDKKPLEEVNYRLKWLYNISVVGDLYALDSGLFAKHGLAVNVKPGGPEKDAIKELELGHAQFGVASADQVIRAVSKGSPIVVIAQLFQTNPLHWIYRPDKTPLKTPQDLKGLTIGITHGGNDETIMRALLAKYGIQQNEVTLFSVRYDYTPFYQGKVDLWPLYRNAQAPIIGGKLQKAGERFDLMDPSRLGIRFVANSVVTTRKMLEEKRETVQQFIKALLQGWREALDPANKETAIQLLLKYNKETPEEIVRQQLPATRILMMPSADLKFGTIDVAAWKQTEEIMLAQKLIPVRIYVEKLLKPMNE